MINEKPQSSVVNVTSSDLFSIFIDLLNSVIALEGAIIKIHQSSIDADLVRVLVEKVNLSQIYLDQVVKKMEVISNRQ